jgi:hypothetical protein
VITTEGYLEQLKIWPKAGKHILAHFDADSIVVYQAYRPSIARYAVEHGGFGGEFSFSRMSWVKPNFLWMMFRCGWGMKPDQEVTLAIRLRRTFFEKILSSAAPSTWDQDRYPERDQWSRAVSLSEVRVQWDPDHDPSGSKLQRRAIQLGLRGETLRAFGTHEILEIIDLTEFVNDQRKRMASGGARALILPRERTYLPVDPEVSARLGISEAGCGN